jgi:hypothetical protein
MVNLCGPYMTGSNSLLSLSYAAKFLFSDQYFIFPAVVQTTYNMLTHMHIGIYA